MTTASTSEVNDELNETTELAPSFTIPLGLIICSIPLVLVQKWLGLAIAIFGFFLLFQALTLRLHFTANALEIYRGKTLIRNFPYQDWLHWEIYSPTLPILFYFRETKSIHFLPILFDPQTLQACLERRFPR